MYPVCIKNLMIVQLKCSLSNYIITLFFENMHLKACKRFLDINRRNLNIALVGEISFHD